ncbi:Alkaline phosphatase [Rubellimicrobium mesophilum DSM 19309]|uniref:Alkaline phosphatase n=1 Tax=Rubellimicrobium mesophilum DSM 19309 TaxID=442562 RepID=A0A017HVL7_9RHOB|nr:hypothetical protein [Rubellimicrobium mesophilum]EYD78198.1 Alkaline phosphatase [Rubellimicrobium mesophilum DSM 19309]
MGTYTGTERNDLIGPTSVTDGVIADPPGSKPGAGSDSLVGNGGDDDMAAGEGDDILDGGDGDDILDGGDGDDHLSGGNGDDQQNGGEGDDWLFDAAGDDRLYGGDGNDWLAGNEGNDQLYGGLGDDRLDGHMGGVDQLYGGPGNDRYVVYDAGDTVTEDRDDPSGGIDVVEAYMSYTLGFGLENLDLGGSFRVGDLNGTGNELDNTIIGTPGRNILRGVGGNDGLFGGRNDDILIGGTGQDSLGGGRGEDVLRGGGGDDDLDGGSGLDRLRGGGGDDTFVFLAPQDGGDTIADFRDAGGNDDRIAIDASRFGGGLEAGTLSRGEFQKSVGHEARDADVRFIFDTQDTSLWFDRNGSKDGGLKMVADLQAGATMAHDDILLF